MFDEFNDDNGSKESDNSAMFNLSNSRNSRTRDLNYNKMKLSEGGISDIFKDDISTLKDFSNLCSSKGQSIIEPIKLKQFGSRNNYDMIRTEPKPAKKKSAVRQPEPCLEFQNGSGLNISRTMDASEKCHNKLQYGLDTPIRLDPCCGNTKSLL